MNDFEALTQRLERLERQNARLKAVLGTVSALACSLLFLAATQQKSPDIVRANTVHAKKFVLVGWRGEVATLSADNADGLAELTMTDQTGKDAIYLGVRYTQYPSPTLRLNTPQPDRGFIDLGFLPDREEPGFLHIQAGPLLGRNRARSAWLSPK